MRLDIYRGASVNLTVNIDESSKLIEKLNGEHYCVIDFSSQVKADLQIGDYITVFSKTYFLNIIPEAKKTGERIFSYTCVFESRMYELGKILYSDGVSSDFFLTGDIEFFIDLIITNLNRVQSGWSKGTIQSGTATKNLQFTNENCLSVLQRLCSEYSLEFKVNEDKSIDVGEFGTSIMAVFKYGINNGLYSIARKTVDSKNLFTRLYPFGGTRNIPANYRNYSPRLKLAADYIEENTATYGIIEHSIIFDDIYPRFTGAVTAAPASNKIRCSTLDFNVNDYLISGSTVKIHFNTGALAGYEFEISGYNNTDKEFTIIPSQQEKTYSDSGLTPFILPNDTLKPAINDEFVILDITMPDSYVTAAEAELLAKATEYLGQNSHPRVGYTVDIDPKYIKESAIELEAGDYVTIEDTDLGIDQEIRITSLTRSIFDENKLSVELSDFLSPQNINRVYAEIEDIKRLVTVNKLGDIARMKRNWRNSEELKNMVFDPDGYFTDKIRPLSIETSLLSIGTRAGNFTLSSTIEANYGRNPNYVYFGSGTLVHFQIETEIRTWNIAVNSQSDLVTGTAYYIYARCNRANNNGVIVALTNQFKVDYNPMYYYFPIGILHAVSNGWRDCQLTYGQSYMVGRMLKVGKIEGQNGLEIDMDTGEISGKVTFTSGSSGYDNLSDTPSFPSEDNLLLHLSFEDIVNNIVTDNSIRGNNGTLSGTNNTDYEATAGKSGGGLKLKTSSGFVTIKDDGYGTFNVQNFTVSAWIKVNSFPASDAYGVMFSYDYTSHSGAYYAIHMRIQYNYSGDKVRLFFGFNIAGTFKYVQSNEITRATFGTGWHHVVVSFTSGTQKIYLDAVQVASGTETGSITFYNQEVWVGKMNSGIILTNWVIDELRFYSNVLSENEIKSLYKNVSVGGTKVADKVKVTIDGGIILASGRIELGPGALGEGVAGIDGAGTASSTIRLWAGQPYYDRASAPFRVQHNGTVHAEQGDIGGWTLATDGIYTGTKKTSDGYSTSGITMASNGSIHAPRFYLNSDGSLGIRSSTSGKRVEIDSTDNAFMMYSSNNDKVIEINEEGAQSAFIATYYSSGAMRGRSKLFSNILQMKSYNSSEVELASIQIATDINSSTVLIDIKNLPTGGSNLKALYIDTVSGRVYRAT